MTHYLLSLWLLCICLNPVQGIFAQSSTPPAPAVVHAVLFFSPNCGHCQHVITGALPPLFEQYGDHLYIVGVDISHPDGQVLFKSALQYFNLESNAVPFLVVGDTYLVGSADIPEKFPGLIEKYLAQGGVDWPVIPGLVEVMPAPPPTETISAAPPLLESAPTSTAVTLPTLSSSVAPTLTSTPGLLLSGNPTNHREAYFASDPLGNSLAVFTLVGMILSVGAAALSFRRVRGAALSRHWQWAIPILCIIGLGIAGYLAYVETTQAQAVCGPVGDCNTVQQSDYARLFGILPIGILGMAGYVMILLAWGIMCWARGKIAGYASIVLLGMCAFGVLFSIYLTFLEPFVIGATCAWCLASAIIMTTLLWCSLAPAKLELSKLFQGEEYAYQRTDPDRTFEGQGP